ncbi:beta-N-acetylhexosaminidase [Rubellicoccus peritrichatus]|uniref:Family 20 glycosylhydrolase n=1 Tax=Rubellicoccus peritrichatus TaxID=3080537 RepID=A0AAQ3QV24_9BACT|nr:family 20 glycosylhydrolase [Puniceicoccus sp. CR14]WOO43021.1 family 20 glycosylhydrolase [Puniceicoccus sp. CR14]
MILVPQPKKISERKGRFAGSVSSVKRTTKSGMGKEAYRLEVHSDGIEIVAGGKAGAFYADKTLQQIKKQSRDGIPCLKIEDKPDFAERAFMLDVSRCKVPTMDSLRRLVDLLADLKFNQLQLYMEHTFAYAGHEIVWGDASPLTGDDIEELDAYCKKRFIELVPNQNSFGHMERWLRHPEYQGMAECPDGFIHPLTGDKIPFGSTLKPDEQSLSFLEELYRDLLPHFSSQKLHAGCDETWELGTGWSEPVAKAEGVETVYLRFLNRVNQLVQNQGKQMLFWADGLIKHPELIAKAPEGALPVVWGYEPAHPFDLQCGFFEEVDIPFYVAPGDSTWNSFSGRLNNAEHNLITAARHGHRHGARGLIHTHWGDNGHPQTWITMLPGLLIASAVSWNASEPPPPLASALDKLIFRDESSLGSALCELAGIDADIPVARPNRSFLFDSFFQDAKELKPRLDEITEEAIYAATDRLDGIVDGINDARPKADDGAWLIDELQLAHDMCSLGLGRLIALKHGRNLNSLRPSMIELIGRYEEIWLRRNRPGGLHESSERLRNVLRTLS